MPRSQAITDRQRAKVYEKFTRNTNTFCTDREELKTIQFYQEAINYPGFMHNSKSSTTHSLPRAYPVNIEAQDHPQVIHHHHDSGVPWWAFLMFNRNGGTTIINNGTPSPREERKENNTNPNFAAWVGILVIAGVAIAPALGGSFYLLGELGQNLERLYYNEGYLQAGLGMANIALSLSLSAVLTNAVLSTAITALAVSAGFSNPVGWAFFIMSCVTLFAAACIHWAVQEGIYKTTAYFNHNALNPEDPERFMVTDEQVKNIIRKGKKEWKGLDGDKMQNVITAIHHDMTTDPTRMTRIFRYNPFFRDADTAAKLSAIRTLRNNGKVNYSTEIETEEASEKTLSFTTNALFS